MREIRKLTKEEIELVKGCNGTNVQFGYSYKKGKQIATPLTTCGTFSKELNKICLCYSCQDKIIGYRLGKAQTIKDELEFLIKVLSTIDGTDIKMMLDRVNELKQLLSSFDNSGVEE